MAWALFGGFIGLMLLRVPVTMAIGFAVLASLIVAGFSGELYILPLMVVEGVENPSLLAVPFFIMAGNLMNAVGMTDKIFNFAMTLVGHFRAGLAQVNVMASMIFAGVSGAAVADIAGLGMVEIRAMRERGYPADFAAALTVCSAVIGPIIPPSISLVIYAFLSNTSVARLFLAGIVGAVLMSGMVKMGEINILGIHRATQDVVRDAILIILAILSMVTTKKEIREDNEFTWFPMKEVAILFIGIFMTMMPCLAILQAGEKGALVFLVRTVREPVHYFWITGVLSSLLDNAPTYLTFLSSVLGKFYPGVEGQEAINMLIRENNIYLKAISAGAVFFGANTYIGNAPNFMVRSIAEETGTPMPSFFGYMLKYSIPILIPVFVLVTLIFYL